MQSQGHLSMHTVWIYVATCFKSDLTDDQNGGHFQPPESVIPSLMKHSVTIFSKTLLKHENQPSHAKGGLCTDL